MLPYAGLGSALKSTLFGLGRGVNAFFYIVSCWQSVKIHEDLLKLRGFHYMGGGSVPPPMSCQTLGKVTRQKPHCLALLEAWMHFSTLYHVGRV